MLQTGKPLPIRPGTVRRLIAVAASRVAAGWPSPADDYLEGHIDLSEHLIPRPAATFLIRAAGWSMRDAGICDGDTLVVDRSVRARDGQIVVAIVEGEFVVKYLRTRGKPRLVAAHPDYPDIPLEGREHQIWGTVTWVLHHAL
ncbi:LexA family protein [Mycobacteroides abscessus]|uniref:LexA family protein n=1 Tax=Mycobacteroides abscessus TaxID=36809 RepID=UPI000925BB88|nr:translesion error-prone DNA polymerase V autoproteolytic subunit [Mycobacteroides abscessus]MBL3752300.1 translesion error-prone DNA polymerase V autoproteolytic subunit [Mycobacteroides abscessus subsp. massiliense]QCO29046.1 peptidase S24 [Mycobacteroides abscessus subsp. massiliense]SHY28796.1 LexA repressor [Mycobacteroides abscessus subsp. abscessus]SID71422.1 LexA repressor [Mycobacteroides abscessus subsp. abscessus]SIK22840.1 LexA repressor [Mycobacteroides abscessus subsp. abscessu